VGISAAKAPARKSSAKSGQSTKRVNRKK
jgi:hypothetical protein